MTQVALLIAICLSFGASPAQLKPDRVVDCWEITNTEWDSETFTFKEDRSYVHVRQSGKTIDKSIGSWSVSGKSISLKPSAGKASVVDVLLAVRPEEDMLVFGQDTRASRQSLIAERRLADRVFLDQKGECLEYKEKGGSAYRIFFRRHAAGKFEIVLWPQSQKDADRLEKLARAELRRHGFTLKHRVEVDRRGY